MYPLLRMFSRVALVASIGLFVACLFGDGYYIDGPDPRAWSPAVGLLLCGWVGLFFGVFNWFANPALLLAWILHVVKRYEAATLAAGAAFLLMIGFLFRTTIVSSEAPTYSRITGLGAGYWLWVAAGGIQTLGGLAGWFGVRSARALTRFEGSRDVAHEAAHEVAV